MASGIGLQQRNTLTLPVSATRFRDAFLSAYSVVVRKVDYTRAAEQWINELKAESRLGDLDVCEDLAIAYEQEGCTTIRRLLREQYYRTIGVYPEARRELREVLAQIASGGGASIEDVVEELRRDIQRNGVGPVDGGASGEGRVP